VVWLPEQAHVRANGDCFVADVVAEDSSRVRTGDVVLRCADPELVAEHRVAQARVHELQSRYRAQRQEDLAEAMVAAEELQAARKELADLERRVAELEIRAAADGNLVLRQPADLAERFFARGDTVGYVVPNRALTARAVVHQSDIDLVRNRLLGASVRVAGELEHTLSVASARVVPAGDTSVPSPALTQAGGGELANDPEQRDPSTTFVRTFEVEIQIEEPVAGLFGTRLFVRFDHGTASLGRQCYRLARRAFLELFDA
jgi:putative peptide zinc metalloprotease protein